MTIEISRDLLSSIEAHSVAAFPEETAGFLVGSSAPRRRVSSVLPLKNEREHAARHNRYLIPALEFARAEREAELGGFELLGVYHSHPNHPSAPSEFDREWAQPVFVYFITSVENGRARDTRAWLLRPDRSGFDPETIRILEQGEIG